MTFAADLFPRTMRGTDGYAAEFNTLHRLLNGERKDEVSYVMAEDLYSASCGLWMSFYKVWMSDPSVGYDAARLKPMFEQTEKALLKISQGNPVNQNAFNTIGYINSVAQDAKARAALCAEFTPGRPREAIRGAVNKIYADETARRRGV